MVVADKEIQDGIARASCHGLDDLVRDWWDARVANSDGIKGLEVVDESERAILLLDTEPMGAVGGIGALVHACSNLLLEQLGHFVKKAWGYGKIFVCPRDVLDNGDSD